MPYTDINLKCYTSPVVVNTFKFLYMIKQYILKGIKIILIVYEVQVIWIRKYAFLYFSFSLMLIK